MPRLKTRAPSYRRHKASGQAIVTLNGRDHYLGRYGSPESQQECQRLIAEWFTTGQTSRTENVNSINGRSRADLVIDELLAAYWRHAEAYYVKYGRPTHTLSKLRRITEDLHKLYGSSSVTNFGPLALKALRDRWIANGKYCRQTINEYAGWVKEIFRWGVEVELVSESVHASLRLVRGLGKGRVRVREGQPIKPVADPFVEALKPYLCRQIWAMIELENLSRTWAIVDAFLEADGS